MNKSNVAYLFTARNMSKNLSNIYFWTFTLPYQLPVSEAIACWNYLLTDLRRSVAFRRGVRVFELHPGGHGLHVHVLMQSYYDVDSVRKCCRRCGWGRVNVKRVFNVSDSIDYVGKYLSKSRPESLKGVRLWAALGLPHGVACRVVDLLFDGTVRSLSFRLVTAKEIDFVCGPFSTARNRSQVRCALANKKYYKLMVMSELDFVKVKLLVSTFC